jgi:hypothetical protein
VSEPYDLSERDEIVVSDILIPSINDLQLEADNKFPAQQFLLCLDIALQWEWSCWLTFNAV